ncbi:hypothetical protein NECID01_0957 [Nematocida sp. AWRm77]|nr:hypothetical protein NECID01_0957 [Nematocida sp. AWRm77]
MQKRKYGEEKRDEEEVEHMFHREDFYTKLISDSKLLLEEEFCLVAGGQYNYETYFKKFYDINIKDFLIKGYDKDMWFQERDLCMVWMFSESFMQFRDFVANRPSSLLLEETNISALLSADLFDGYTSQTQSVHVIALKNIETNFAVKSYIEETKEKVPIQEWAMSQHGLQKAFKKTLYLRVEAESYDEVKEKLSEDLPKQVVVCVHQMPKNASSGVRVCGKQFGDKHVMEKTEAQCKQILCAMANLFGVPEVAETLKALEARTSKEEIADLYILGLRKIFNFCYYCGVKYDNPYEMMLKCGIFHVRSTEQIDTTSVEHHTRSVKFYTVDRTSMFKQMDRTIDVSIFSKEIGESANEYICKYCSKRFTAKEYFEKHLSRKHIEYEAYTKLQYDFFVTIFSLNYQTIEMIEQRGQQLPYEIFKYIQQKLLETESVSAVSYADLEKRYAILDKMPISVTDSDTE